MTETTWRVVGYDTKQERHDSLLYVTETLSQAYDKCVKLHPHFDVYFVQRVDD